MTKKISVSTLFEFTKNILLSIGLRETDSEIITESLIEAELRGVKTHGLVRLPVYLARMKQGGINKYPEIKVLNDLGATMLLDGDAGCGQIVGKLAMQEAIKKADIFGISFVGVRNSNHFGIAAYYSLMAARSNFIGFVFSNASPRLAPTGGASKQLGNNPISVAFPVPGGEPIVIDMALSVVAAGKIRLAAANNEKIPLGWAIDKDGQPTTDPQEALEGFLLPIGDHKGYALSFMVDLLCGLLTGSSFGKDVGSIDNLSLPQNEGHAFGAIKISNFMGIEEYGDKVRKFISNLKEGKKATGVKEILVPGEIETRYKNRQLKEGISLEPELIEKLNEIALQLGLSQL